MSTVFVDPLLVVLLRATYPPARAVCGRLPRLSPLMLVETDSNGCAHLIATDIANARQEYASPPVRASVLESEESTRAAEKLMHMAMVAPFN